MKKAVGLLRGSDLSVEEITIETGYISQMGFYKAFKKRFGMTPGEFRASAHADIRGEENE